MRAGEPFSISGGGFAPATKLEITLHSNPVSLGTTKSDAQGKFSSKVTIPADTQTGAHTIVVSGPAPDGSQHTVGFPIVVMATGESSAATGFSVPAIRHQVGLLWALAMLPIGLGFGLVYRALAQNGLRRPDPIAATGSEVEILEPSMAENFRPAPVNLSPPPAEIASLPRRRRVELTGELRQVHDEALVPGSRD